MPSGDSATARFLVVNADDLGLSAAVNAGIAAAHERGIVTSASLMVRQGAAAEAAAYAAAHPALAVGLHLDLGEWDYVDGEWMAAYQRCDARRPRRRWRPSAGRSSSSSASCSAATRPTSTPTSTPT